MEERKQFDTGDAAVKYTLWQVQVDFQLAWAETNTVDDAAVKRALSAALVKEMAA